MNKQIFLAVIVSTIIVSGISISSIYAQQNTQIPEWIRNNALWWGQGQISDSDFISAISYLMENRILKISQSSVEEEYKEWAKAEISKYKEYSDSVKLQNDNLYKDNQELNEINNRLEKSNSDLRQSNSELSRQNYNLQNSLDDANYNQPSTNYNQPSNWNKQYVEEVAKTNPLIQGLINGKLRFYIEPLPYYANTGLEQRVNDIADALESRSISELKFERVYDPNYSDLYISWIKNYGPHTLGETIFGAHVKIGLGTDNCYGDWKVFDNDSVVKIMWHEIGHSLGYGHSEDPSNVMFWQTDTRFEEDYFETLSLTEGYYQYIPFCNAGAIYYEITSDDQYNGFDIYVLPPDSDPQEVIDGIGFIYSDCGANDMISFSNTCNVAEGAGLMIHNKFDSGKTANNIDVSIVNMESGFWPDMSWDEEAFEYDIDQLNEIWALYH